MKKVTKFFMAALLAGICSFGYGQDYKNPPKQNEKVVGSVYLEKSPDGWSAHSYRGWYHILLEQAKREYPGKTIDIRELTVGRDNNCESSDGGGHSFCLPVFAKVIEIGSPESQGVENLSKAMDKALRNVREGSRVAIDMVTVSGGVSINREDLKDQIIDALLDKGYKVVAKDYLEKMYEEQEAQQSGIYNESTTVKENNFSAVGYYINVKVTETSLRVQVVNVSTGEYEGNATVNF